MEVEDNRGPLLVRVDIILGIISTIVILSRAYSRAAIIRNWGLDDTLAIFAWVRQHS